MSDRYSGPVRYSVQDGLFRHVADLGFVFEDVIADVGAVEHHRTAGLLEQAREDRDGRRFAGPVRTEQPEYAARR